VFSALSDMTDRLNPKVLVAYVLPALVATSAGVGILALLIGPPLLDAWINDLDGFDQLGFGVLFLGLTIILALFFQAMRRPILHLFAGDTLPKPLADWAIRRQQRATLRASQMMPTAGERGPDEALLRWRSMLDRAVPLQSQHIKPTRFGNMLANLEDHTEVVHGMDYRIWWPRLAPLLPATMRDIVAAESANMTGLLNLSLVWAIMAIAGAAVLGLLGGRWGPAAAVLVAGLLLSWVSYRAAIREGAEAARHLHAAFDLYRHEILKHMALEVPEDAEAERALWRRLTTEMVVRVVPIPGVGAAPDGFATATTSGAPRSKPSVSQREGADR
jgi:hypothetical protein